MPGIFAQVFVRGELGRIDEVGGDDAVGAARGLAHQRQVAFMQGAHGRNHADAQALSFPVPDDRTQFGDGADDGEGGGVYHYEAINLSA